jgi:hypothetical protein
MRFARRTALLLVIVAACVGAALATGVVSRSESASADAGGSCQLGTKAGKIKHVIYLQFDNTHYRRDNPNVASDLEQMPNLLNFLKGNGTLLTNDHTILISHTAGGIVSSLSGLYPDRNGQTVSNSYDYFKPTGAPQFTSSFKYWTDTVDGTNETLPNMVGDGGQTAPAPWLTYTHAGCNVGGVSAANIELENANQSPSGDMTRVFGSGSPEWTEAGTNSARALADFVGIAIHCAQGNSLCSTANHGKPDDATVYPGSDDGYNALFGAKYVNAAIGSTSSDADGTPCIKTVDGSANITDAAGRCGFPGFDGALAKNTLGEVAQMQENGVPVTFAYISDAHDNHTLAQASGPGENDYQQQLAAYNAAFGSFFNRLKNDGIDKSNTLFVVTVDEGDHFVGGTGSPDPSHPGALTYSHTKCFNLTTTCPSNQIGEVNVNLPAFLPAGEPSFDIHFDDAPTFYVNGQPERTNPALRKLERDVAGLSLSDPYAQGGTAAAAQQLADPVEEAALHMVNSDPKRTPSFTMFGNPDFFFQIGNVCKGPSPDPGVTECVNPGFAWNHGDVQEEIANTWAGFVGPGVNNGGIDENTWTDHVDLRPTINALLGVGDEFTDDGRVITQILSNQATPQDLNQHGNTTADLGDIYKQINAPFGKFAMDTLTASTVALKQPDTTAGNLKYDSIESQIANLTARRNDIAGTIRDALNAAAKGDGQIQEKNAKDWISQAQALLDDAAQLAATS